MDSIVSINENKLTVLKQYFLDNLKIILYRFKKKNINYYIRKTLDIRSKNYRAINSSIKLLKCLEHTSLVRNFKKIYIF